MKIILAGNYSYHIYEEAVLEAMENLGHHVIRFKYSNYVQGLLGKIEEHFSLMSVLSYYMNYKLLTEVKKHEPEILLIWRGTLISPFFLKKISQGSRTTIVSFNNDDPFSEEYQKGNISHKRLWRKFKNTIPQYDINLVYRPLNVKEYDDHGSKKTIIFPPYFIPKALKSSDQIEKKYDVSFTGHRTEERENIINFLLNHGVKIKLFGTGWKIENISKNYPYDKEITPVYGADYDNAMQSSKICLAFLSKLNRDVYTRRNFEIPASGTLMLSERTKELEELFVPNQEALFFSSAEEALLMVTKVLGSIDLLNTISNQGKERAYRSGYSVEERVKKMLTQIES